MKSEVLSPGPWRLLEDVSGFLGLKGAAWSLAWNRAVVFSRERREEQGLLGMGMWQVCTRLLDFREMRKDGKFTENPTKPNWLPWWSIYVKSYLQFWLLKASLPWLLFLFCYSFFCYWFSRWGNLKIFTAEIIFYEALRQHQAVLEPNKWLSE